LKEQWKLFITLPKLLSYFPFTDIVVHAPSAVFYYPTVHTLDIGDLPLAMTFKYSCPASKQVSGQTNKLPFMPTTFSGQIADA
jgi:hypothetical protein